MVSCCSRRSNAGKEFRKAKRARSYGISGPGEADSGTICGRYFFREKGSVFVEKKTRADDR